MQSTTDHSSCCGSCTRMQIESTECDSADEDDGGGGEGGDEGGQFGYLSGIGRSLAETRTRLWLLARCSCSEIFVRLIFEFTRMQLNRISIILCERNRRRIRLYSTQLGTDRP